MELYSKDSLVKIFGTDELIKAFQELDYDLQSKVLSNAFRKAGKLIISAAQGNLGGSYKHVQKSLTMSFRKEIQTLNVGASKRRGGHLAHIAEAGTQDRQYITKTGRVHKTGRVIGRKFWENANLQTENEVERIVYDEIKQRFDKILKKHNKAK